MTASGIVGVLPQSIFGNAVGCQVRPMEDIEVGEAVKAWGIRFSR